ncbi:DUF7146 domain-containing protein [Shinella sp. M31]|uniref:DUF7146 domain-containing protein n=1 Tax=Shinella sp. M31 TaxID=3368615 RepID=UPI003B9F32D2
MSPAKEAWNCRQCGRGGRDGVGLIGFVHDHDMHSRSGFLAACGEALGRDPPAGAERETEEHRTARVARVAERDADIRARAHQPGHNVFRENAIQKGRNFFFRSEIEASPETSIVGRYLAARTGFVMHAAVFGNLRLAARHGYWADADDRGNSREVHVGPAMIAPFIDPIGQVTGCHETWIDLSNGPKFRPALLDAAGVPRPTKKMQGVKQGSMIPIFGALSARRWVGGEGIENVATIAGAEAFRGDTFYFAAGDIGNLCGPADPDSAFTHPSLKKADRNGVLRSVRVQGPEPKPGVGIADAVHIPDHVTELVILADGDSEPVFTAAAMARAEKLHAHEGRGIETWWPPAGGDFADLMTG